jgi:hypothetical protein
MIDDDPEEDKEEEDGQQQQQPQQQFHVLPPSMQSDTDDLFGEGPDVQHGDIEMKGGGRGEEGDGEVYPEMDFELQPPKHKHSSIRLEPKMELPPLMKPSGGPIRLFVRPAKPPGKFVGRVAYKKKTQQQEGNDRPLPETWDKACWWDTCEFKTKPVGCPTRYDSLRDIYFVDGFFCSWNCARAWGSHFAPQPVLPFLGAWILKLVRAEARAEGVQFEACKYKCQAAPHYSLLDKFTPGGLTIEQFRAIHCTNTRVVTLPAHLHLVPYGVNVFTVPKRVLPQQQQPPKQDEKLPWDWSFLDQQQPPQPAAEKKHPAAVPLTESEEKKRQYNLFKKPVSHAASKWKLERAKPTKPNPLMNMMKITMKEKPAKSKKETKTSGR